MAHARLEHARRLSQSAISCICRAFSLALHLEETFNGYTVNPRSLVVLETSLI